MSISTRSCDFCGTENRLDARFCGSCGRLLISDINAWLNNPPSMKPLLKQRYRILDKLGQGGMASVYRAEDLLFNNALRAIKEMGQDGLRLKELQAAVAAFKQEAMLLANLRHQNLPRIYDYFEEGGYWYLIMDYIDGQTLDSLLTANGGKLLVKDTLVIGIQLCTVLEYLHSQQPPIIFRDLKPSNVMVTVDDHVYLIDFGIARLFKPGKAVDTERWGTQGYAAPEQYGATQTDARADVFALGALLYQLLSAHDPTTTPFKFPPLHLSKRSPIAALEPLIISMVDPERENRPTSAQEVKQELQAVFRRLDSQSSTFLAKRYITC